MGGQEVVGDGGGWGAMGLDGLRESSCSRLAENGSIELPPADSPDLQLRSEGKVGRTLCLFMFSCLGNSR